MKTFKKVVVVLGIILLALIIVSQFLPSTYHSERSINISAKSEDIFPWVNRLQQWQAWSPWTGDKDPSITYTYEGPAEGVGAISKWESKKWGDGMMKITESDAATGVKFDLAFNKGRNICQAAVQFRPAGDAIKVIWSMDGKVSRNPIDRLFSMMIDKFVGKDFEEGLENLKKRVEAK